MCWEAMESQHFIAGTTWRHNILIRMALGLCHISCSNRVACRTSSTSAFHNGQTCWKRWTIVFGECTFFSLDRCINACPSGGSKGNTCMAPWLHVPPLCVTVNISHKGSESQLRLDLCIWQDSMYRHAGAGNVFVSTGK